MHTRPLVLFALIPTLAASLACTDLASQVGLAPAPTEEPEPEPEEEPEPEPAPAEVVEALGDVPDRWVQVHRVKGDWVIQQPCEGDNGSLALSLEPSATLALAVGGTETTWTIEDADPEDDRVMVLELRDESGERTTRKIRWTSKTPQVIELLDDDDDGDERWFGVPESDREEYREVRERCSE